VRELKLGVVQLRATYDKRENLNKLREMVGGKDVDLIVTPEYLMANPSDLSPDELYEIAEELEGEYVEELSKIARECSSWLIGHMFERTSRRPKVYNTAVVIDDGGNLRGFYRKMHLFDAYGYKESTFMERGDRPSEVFEVRSVKVAVAICFDLRFPELFRYYALKGVELIAVPSAWYKGPGKEEAFQFLARARAHENTVFLALANQYGGEFIGRSMVVDPLGFVILDAGIGEKMQVVSIDADEVEEVRRMLPVLSSVRRELFELALRIPRTSATG